MSDDEAEAIRHQVEWYFSDENLARPDRFLLKMMHGRENQAVPVEIIRAFPKMKDFRPSSAVVEALRESAQLDIIKLQNGVEGVKRKTPFVLEDHNAGAKSKIARAKATGFEEYWTDSPVTPKEFQEEHEDMYAPQRRFQERIQIAIQRYRSKRKFHNLPKDIFDKFLKYGGIDSGPKQFTGGFNKADLEHYTAGEIALLNATDYVGDDKDEETGLWVVDFEGVAKGFLSTQASKFNAQFRDVTNILNNFYNYLLHHNVCPEHESAILAARSLCALANKEHLAIREVMALFPGTFNMAASRLFGGYQASLLDEPNQADWMDKEVCVEGEDRVERRLNEKEARQIFAVGVAAVGRFITEPNTLFNQTIISSETIGLEVTSIIRADEETRRFYDEEVGSDFDCIGLLKAQSWAIPDFAEMDLPADVQQTLTGDRDYTFLVEEKLLEHCFVGMKIEATVKGLSGGVHFLDEVNALHPSYYTLLENELIGKWKEPKWFTREEIVAKMERQKELEGAVGQVAGKREQGAVANQAEPGSSGQ